MPRTCGPPDCVCTVCVHIGPMMRFPFGHYVMEGFLIITYTEKAPEVNLESVGRGSSSPDLNRIKTKFKTVPNLV